VPSAWSTVEEKLPRHFHQPDIPAARVLVSAGAGHWFPDAPVSAMPAFEADMWEVYE
jgi:hypothetical protein